MTPLLIIAGFSAIAIIVKMIVVRRSRNPRCDACGRKMILTSVQGAVSTYRCAKRGHVNIHIETTRKK